MYIADKHVLITGGLGSLGQAIALGLREDGAKITLFDQKRSEEWDSYALDVCDETEVGQALSALPPVDVLVHCAGEIYSEPLCHLLASPQSAHSRESWDRVLRANLTSTFNMNVQVACQMAKARRQGVLINFSSIAARGNAGQIAYASAKAGVEALTRVVAEEMGMLGIRAVAIAPGFIDTPSTRRSLSPSALEHYLKRTPLRRLGATSDIVQTVAYAIACEHLNGCVLPVDGGLIL